MPSPGPLHVRWQCYRPAWRNKEPPRHFRAILARRVISEKNGRPVMEELGYVSAYDASRLADPAMQAEFWTRAKFRLGKMRLPPNVITLIEQALAKRVPMPDQARRSGVGFRRSGSNSETSRNMQTETTDA